MLDVILLVLLQIDYPKDSDMMEVFECQKTQTNKYDNIVYTCMCTWLE